VTLAALPWPAAAAARCGKVVSVDPVITDPYGRTVAFVRVGDVLVNEESIRQGLAWVYTRFCDRAICE